METSREVLKMVYDGKDGDKKFSYIINNLEMKNKTDKEITERLLMYLSSVVNDFYYNNFTIDNNPTTEALSY